MKNKRVTKALIALTTSITLLTPLTALADETTTPSQDSRSKMWTEQTTSAEPGKAQKGGVAGEDVQRAQRETQMLYDVAKVDNKQVEPITYGKGITKNDDQKPEQTTGTDTATDAPTETAGGEYILTNLDLFAKQQDGKPYTWGGPKSQDDGADCSGFQSELAAIATGKDPWKRYFYTGNQATALKEFGFKKGLGPKGSYNIAWYNDPGGDGGGHTAGTLPSGKKVESGGSPSKMKYEKGAVGADHSQFKKSGTDCWEQDGGQCSSSAHLPPDFFKKYNEKVKPDQITWKTNKK